MHVKPGRLKTKCFNSLIKPTGKQTSKIHITGTLCACEVCVCVVCVRESWWVEGRVSTGYGGFSSQRASDARSFCMALHHHEMPSFHMTRNSFYVNIQWRLKSDAAIQPKKQTIGNMYGMIFIKSGVIFILAQTWRVYDLIQSDECRHYIHLSDEYWHCIDICLSDFNCMSELVISRWARFR